nr:MAG TPA: hypothetical protein [Caudoviricetes sp.]
MSKSLAEFGGTEQTIILLSENSKEIFRQVQKGPFLPARE